MSTQKNEPRALALGISCYVIWGFFPLYFSRLAPAGAVEVIVHRAVWGLVFCLAALAVTGSLGKVRALIADRGALWRLAVAGALVVVNWSVYVYAVLAGHTTDAAIGYFINPLVTVALGLVVLRERITPIQKIALGLGALAVLILIVGQRSVPITSLTLALTFGLYSLVKKDVAARVDPLAGMVIETAAVSPLLLAYYAYLAATSATSFHALASATEAGVSWGAHLALLVGAGALTMIPLIMFAAAARGLTLGTMGFLQYLGPTLQLLVAVFIFGEEVPLIRWVAMGVVWLALACLSADWALSAIRARRLARTVRDA
ncbi:EamA family transporter RarD [Kytococcus sedentarius]|uniref:EamA family transporter RarD n=1 Tax=Kytococcus sedentarius TaxID=1276 RepID=UPI0006604F7B|nr:EamA family transporter RarD [Kytococcus sedentarius]